MIDEDELLLLVLYGVGRNKVEVEEGDENASANGAICDEQQQMTSETRDAAAASGRRRVIIVTILLLDRGERRRALRGTTCTNVVGWLALVIAPYLPIVNIVPCCRKSFEYISQHELLVNIIYLYTFL